MKINYQILLKTFFEMHFCSNLA